MASSKTPKGRQRRVRKTGSHSTRVNAEVLDTARDIAGGDMRRVEVVSEREVIVWNHPRSPITSTGR